MLFRPYFYVDVLDVRRVMELSQALLKRFEGCAVEQAEREDLDLPNHLSGKKHTFIKISFGSVAELNEAKQTLRPVIQANQQRLNAAQESGEDVFAEDGAYNQQAAISQALTADPMSHLCDLR